MYFVTDREADAAMLVTMDETTITCCSSGSFVSRGHFRNFCLRFADKFDYMTDNWMPGEEDIMNTCKYLTIWKFMEFMC